MSRHATAKPGVRPWPTLTPLGQGAMRPIRIGRDVCLIGSHSRVHLPLRSPVISRVHALIVCDKHEAYVRDMASRHGVFISGNRIREGRLRDGDAATRAAAAAILHDRTGQTFGCTRGADGTARCSGDHRQEWEGWLRQNLAHRALP